VAITNRNEVAAGASERCADKRRLLDAYRSATASFLATLTLLNERIGTSSREQYETLRRTVDIERVKSEQARLAPVQARLRLGV
jgi:hypothetical protein